MEDSLSAIKSDPKTLQIFQSRLRLTKDGGEWKARCPFHSDSTPSFTLNSKRGDWVYYCFGCKSTGTVLDFVQKMDNLSLAEAIKKVKSEVGGWSKTREVDNIFKPLAEDEKPKNISLETYEVMIKQLRENPEAIKYLSNRGISLRTAINCKIGFRHNLPGRKEEGWLSIPTVSGNQVLGIKYRCITAKEFASQKGMQVGLFNADRLDQFSPIFLTEGEIDTLSFEEAGYRGISIGSAGTKLTPEQKDLIMEAESIYLAGDNDPAGSECMNRLWNDLQDRTFLIQWPAEIKDANALLMKIGLEKFKQEIPKLMIQAKTTPMPYVKSLQESLATSNRVNLADHPGRLRFPWPSVDRMAILLPGSVMTISATSTKMGKTNFIKDVSLYNAMRGSIVLNYQCELSPDEFGNMVAAGLLKKNRNHLTVEDNIKASKELEGIRYYIGRNPTLTTVEPVLDLIENAVRRLSCDVVILDHIHYVVRNCENEVSAQSNAIQRIKNMAVKYGLKFIVVCQPRKAQQANRGKVLHVSDLKGSASLGDDADAIFVLHRDQIKVKDELNPPMDNYDPKVEVHLLGARAKGDGSTFACLQFFGEYASLVEPTRQENTSF